MPDLRPLPALVARTPLTSPRVRLSALPAGTFLQVIAGPPALDQNFDIDRVATDAGLALRTISPGQWILVGDRATSYPDMRRLLRSLEPHGSGTDQSHSRVRMHLEGPMAAAVLSKGAAVDLDPSAFPQGHTVATLVGHISAHLTRLDAEAFEVAVMRSFAESLWDDLAQMCAEFA